MAKRNNRVSLPRGNKMIKDNNCELCKLVFDNDVKTELHYQDDSIIIVNCLTHKDTPIVVLREHRLLRSKSEQEHIRQICLKLFPDRRFRMKGMNKIPFHWHEHLIQMKGENNVYSS